MLTFLCEDFEEITTADVGEDARRGDGMIHCSETRGTASFKVRCVHDGEVYTATFFTSEMDKVRKK